MRPPFRKAKLTVLATILFVATSQPHGNESEALNFVFNPGESLRFVERKTSLKTTDFAAYSTYVEKITLTNQYTIEKTTAGWEVRVEPKSIAITRDGKAVDNPMDSPIVNAFMSTPITYKLDPAGNVKGIQGYETFLKKYSGLRPPEILKAFAPILSLNILNAGAIDEWNDRIGDFLAIEPTLGESRFDTKQVQMPNGSSIQYNIETMFEAIEPCGENTCVRIRRSYDSRDDNLVKYYTDILNDALSRTAIIIQDNSVHETRKVTRLIDPSTMLIYSEQHTSTIEARVVVPLQGETDSKLTNITIYEFFY